LSTIRDVARVAGVGVGTASRVISGNGPVSADAVARVLAAVSELDFRPSSSARALASRKTGMLGVYVTEFSGHFFAPILLAVDHELRAVDRHMVAATGCGTGDARQLAREGIDFLIERECDGILLFSNELLDSDLLLLHQKCPQLAVINRSAPGIERDCFTVDHVEGGRLAARALLERGHREIAIISGRHTATDNEARLAGFDAELARHGLRVPAEMRADGGFTFEGGTPAMGRLLEGDRPFSAVFAANDLMAMAAIGVLDRAGLRVPQDVSVIGYDNTDFGAYMLPRLTTVCIPTHEVARNATRHLINRCYGKALPLTRQFAPSLIWRDSVGPGPHPPLPAERQGHAA
jgi:LacI family transcriptional regulator